MGTAPGVKAKKTHSRSATWFAGKLTLRVLNVEGQGFRARIFHAYLCRRARIGEGCTLGEVARATGLSRNSACLLARESLLGAKLIEPGRGHLLHPVEPTGEALKRFGKPVFPSDYWADRYPYVRYYAIRPGVDSMSLVDAWLYSMLWSLDDDDDAQVEGLSLAGLGALTGLHRATVAESLRTLTGLGLVRSARAKGHREYFKVAMDKPEHLVLDLFQDQDRPVRKLEYEELPPFSGVNPDQDAEVIALDQAIKNVTITVDEDDEEDEVAVKNLFQVLMEEKGIVGKQYEKVKEAVKKCRFKDYEDIEDLIETLDCKKTQSSLFPLLMTDLKRRKVRD